MALAAFNFRITRSGINGAGELIPNVTITVRREQPGAPLVPVYADRDGTVSLGDPFVSATGSGRFHVVGGVYRIDATADGFSDTLRYVGIGTAQELDAGGDIPLVQEVDAGYGLVFEAETSAPPSAGAIRFNNANLSLATEAYVSVENIAGSNIEARLLELFNATHTVKDTFLIADPATDRQASWRIDGAATDGPPATYVTFTISAHDGATSFTDDERVNFQPNRSGADGASSSGGFDTIAKAQAATIPADVGAVQLKGYSAPGDDGGALYRRVASEPPQDEGKFRSVDRFLPNGSEDETNGGWWEISEEGIHAAFFGYSPAASAATNTAALQAAIDFTEAGGGGSIRLGRGEYVQNPVYITASGVHIRGQGKGATKVKLADSPLANQFSCFAFGVQSNQSTTVAITDCSIEGMTINGNKANQLQGTTASDGVNAGIGAWSVLRFALRDLLVHDCDGYGIGLVGTDLAGRGDYVLENVETYGNLYDGIDIKGGTTNKPLRITTRSVYSHDNGPGVIAGRQAVGIDVRGQWITLYDTHAWNNSSGGIRYRETYCFEAKATACTAINNTGDGFRADGADGGVTYKFLQCHSIGNTASGYRLDRDTDLTDCYSQGNQTGIQQATRAAVIQVNGGRYTGNTQDGILCAVAGSIFSLSNPMVDTNNRHGVNFAGLKIDITGGVIKNNNQGGSGGIGVVLSGTNGLTGWALLGVKITDDQTVKTQTHGVSFSASPGPGTLLGCDLSGNATGEVTGTPHVNTIFQLAGSLRSGPPIFCGNGSLVPSAQFQVESTVRGFMPPRMTTAQRDAISSPAAGLVIYNTTTNALNFYNGTAWGAV